MIKYTFKQSSTPKAITYFDWFSKLQIDRIFEDRPDLSRIQAFGKDLNVILYFGFGYISGNSLAHKVTIHGQQTSEDFLNFNGLSIALKHSRNNLRYPNHLSEKMIVPNGLIDRCSLAMRSCAPCLYVDFRRRKWDLKIVRVIASIGGLANAEVDQGEINGRKITHLHNSSRELAVKDIFISCLQIALDEFFPKGANSLSVCISWRSLYISNYNGLPF